MADTTYEPRLKTVYEKTVRPKLIEETRPISKTKRWRVLDSAAPAAK